MKAHIIPETYLSSWKNNRGSNAVFVFNSANYSFESKNLNVLNNTYFQDKDVYLLKLEECTGIVYKDLFDNIFAYLKQKYKMKYKNIEIDSNYRFRNCCRFLEDGQNWIITDMYSGNRYKFNKFKNEMVNLWNSKFIDEIESFFCNQYETKWNEFIRFLNRKTNKQSGLISLEEFDDYFIEFVSLLLTRQYTNFESYKNIIFLLAKRYQLVEEFDENQMKKIWLSQFFKYKKYKESGSKEYEYNLTTLMSKYLKSDEITLEFLISNDIDFFTSDNPIFRVENKENMVIYFPISNKMCLKINPIKRRRTNTYEYKTVTTEEIKQINTLVVNNCKKDFICKEENFDNYCNIR